ncbi:MAG: tetratricopeptide repeat protein [Verrucomicrobia bacterium]|nr:tetratricopeptide repeat protein [Verrucomicrobiota bacterium]
MGLGSLEPVALFLGGIALFSASAANPRRRLAWLVVASGAVTLSFSCLTRPDVRLLLAWMPLVSCVAASQLVTWVENNVNSFKTEDQRFRLSGRGMRSVTYAGVVVLVALPVALQLGRSSTSARADTPAAAVMLKERLPEDGLLMTDTPAFVAWHLNRPSLLLCQRETDLPKLEKQVGPIAGVYLSPGLGAMSPREVGDWWMWVASTRGVYRGLSVAVNNPSLGLLRLPQTPSATAESEQKWLGSLREIVRENPQSAEAHAQLAFAYFTLGRLREAQQEFHEAAHLDEYNIEALIGLWQTMAQLSHSDGSLRLSQLVSQTPQHDPRSKALLEQAAAHFEQLTTQQPEDPWLALNLILCRSRLDQWKEVEASYQRLAKALPKAFPPRLVMGNLWLQRGEPEKAAAECEQLLQDHPDMPTAHYLAGRVALAQNRLEEALKEFLATVRLRPNWITGHVQAGQVCQRLKRYGEAVKHFEAALALSPHLANLKVGLADAYGGQGKTGEAVRFYREVLAADPKHLSALNNLARLLVKTGKPKEALSFTRQAVSLYPDNPYVHDTAGWVAFQAGDTKKAVQHLREAVRLAPKQGLLHYHLAKALLAEKRSDEARKCLRRAVKCGLSPAEKLDAEMALTGTSKSPVQ